MKFVSELNFRCISLLCKVRKELAVLKVEKANFNDVYKSYSLDIPKPSEFLIHKIRNKTG